MFAVSAAVDGSCFAMEVAVSNAVIRQEKLNDFLASFLHGMRYTSFGRHFTKVEKLEKIIDKHQWYVEDGETVVDEMGKRKCSYKNYDISRPKVKRQRRGKQGS